MSRRVGLRTIQNPGGTSVAPVAIEGDYSTYTAKWKQAYGPAEYKCSLVLRCDESLDLIFIYNTGSPCITTRKLTDGTSPTITTVLDHLVSWTTPGFHASSVLSKYFAFIVDEGGKPKLKIYKSGTLLQTIDLSLAPISWTDVGYTTYLVSISPDGKYIFIDDDLISEYALFEGA